MIQLNPVRETLSTLAESFAPTHQPRRRLSVNDLIAYHKQVTEGRRARLRRLSDHGPASLQISQTELEAVIEQTVRKVLTEPATIREFHEQRPAR